MIVTRFQLTEPIQCLEEYGLPIEVVGLLEKLPAATIGELSRFGDKEVLAVDGMGPDRVRRVADSLRMYLRDKDGARRREEELNKLCEGKS